MLASLLFFFNIAATTNIYTLSLHDALPISADAGPHRPRRSRTRRAGSAPTPTRDRKSTRLNSSHGYNSYAVFCLKKKSAAEHHRGGLWRGRQRLDRRPVHGGRGSRHDDWLR